MNRVDFMNQLERLLQNIAPAERDEALQYYNDYFDDAGSENEQEVIEALGNPARVAENIKRDLFGGGYGEGAARKAQASDRALVEYGQGTQNSYMGDSGYAQQRNAAEQPRKSTEKPVGNAGMPAWAIALLVTLLILCSPVLAGVGIAALSVLFAALVSWYAFIFAFGIAALCLLLGFVILVIVGIICLFVNPWAGMALIGGGLICGAVGILFLMLTVAMAGIITPAVCKGIGSLFGYCKSSWRKCRRRLN